MSAVTDSDIVNILFDYGSDDALEELMDIYEDPIRDAFTIYNRWKRIRSLLIRDSRFINPEYEERMQSLIHRALVTDHTGFDSTLLRNLLLSTIEDKHKIHLFTKRSTFKNREIFLQFKKIKPFINLFYDFKLPDELIIAKDVRVRDIDTLKQMHKSSRSNIFNVSRLQLDEWKKTSQNALRDENNFSKSKIGIAIAAIQLLSGRRLIEILHGMTIVRKGPSDNSAVVTGLAKKKTTLLATVTNEEQELVIPLLCSYDVFKNVIEKIRSIEICTGVVRPYVFTKTTKASKDLFKEKLDHTAKRNLYCELCWLTRDIHLCHTTCSKKAFFGLILGHDLSFDATDQYSNINITYT